MVFVLARKRSAGWGKTSLYPCGPLYGPVIGRKMLVFMAPSRIDPDTVEGHVNFSLTVSASDNPHIHLFSSFLFSFVECTV